MIKQCNATTRLDSPYEATFHEQSQDMHLESDRIIFLYSMKKNIRFRNLPE